jgi:tetratricopeptide (TPR) repeat protein
LAPLVRPARTAELAAELYRDWARQALDEADQASEPAASEARRRGRKLLREAGLRYAAAARLNFSERQYTEDVWEAAEAYRNGHNFTAAAKWYEEYLKYEVKRRRSSALVGWGECLLSLGRTRDALETLKQCYELSPQDIASYSARLLASQAFLQLDEPKQAEALLRENIAGNLLTPASREWRESLFALGKLLSRQQRHDEAINVLSEYVARYPDSRDSIEARYNIAEEYRRAAKEPQQLALADAIETSRLAHLKVVQKYLTAAVTHYEEVQHLLNRRQEREELSPRDQALLRNSYFAAGVAFTDLGRYEDAIRAYATATNHYQHAPEVLEAFVQIAGCYRRLNRPLEARGTIRQAKVVLDRLPADAPYQQTTNFSRTQWAELLDWMITL